MSNELATTQATDIERVLIQGDLSKLSPEQRVQYYNSTCESLGLNPLTQPFAYITLNGKLTLYAKRDAADQLRKINGVSIEIVSRGIDSGLYTVHVRAKDKSGRTDEDVGVVNVANLKGDAAANAILKAVTKAKRRVTLSISGLGLLDETEVEDIPSEARGFPRRNGNHNYNNETGELISDEQVRALSDLCDEVGADKEKFCAYLKVSSLADILASRYEDAVAALEAKRRQQ